MAPQLVDLPLELQIEIFSNFLSVKHLVKVLSINKATHDQLIQSETFWKSLINNYSKAIIKAPSTIEKVFNIATVKTQFLELIESKKKQFESLHMHSNRYCFMINDIEHVREEMQARNEEILKRGGTVSGQQMSEIEGLLQEGEKLKTHLRYIDEQFEKMKID